MVSKKSPFDETLDIWGNRIPEDVRDASTWVNDTLTLSFESARQVFGDNATPEHAIQIYDRFVLRIKEVAMGNSINE